jgi:GGDEF domain-containing protein
MTTHLTTPLSLLAGLVAGAALTALRGRRTVRSLEIDPAYGILTRSGAERRLARLRQPLDVVFLDIDHMHRLNAELGYEEANRLIRLAFQLRRNDAVLVCRWYSGDEILILTRSGDGAGLAERLRTRLASFGLSATIGVVEATPLRVAIEAAQGIVMQSKAARALEVR